MMLRSRLDRNLHIPQMATRWQDNPDDGEMGAIPCTSRGPQVLVSKSKKTKQKEEQKSRKKEKQNTTIKLECLH